MLTRLATRGALINLVFAVVVQLLAAAQGVIVPRLLGPDKLGLFTIAMGGVAIGAVLKDFSIAKKLVQEREVDLYTSYAVGFTIEVLLAGTFLLIVLGIAPLLAYLYHRPDLWLITSLLSFSLFSTAFLDLPSAIPYRELRYVKWNVISSVGPVVTFAVTVPTAIIGWGVWSLVAGTMAGFLASIIVMLFLSPMRPRFAWHRPLVRRYLKFGWPLWLGSVVTLAGGWGGVFVVSSTIGIAGLGYFQLAQGWASRAVQVDNVLADTIFPVLCSIQSSTDRMKKAFMTTTRLSMLWAAPVGAGLFVFAKEFIALLLGPKWHPAVLLVQAEGAGVLIGGLGYNWNIFFEARGETRPQLNASLLSVAWLGAVVLPLLWFFQLKGAAISIVGLALGINVLRQHYLRKLFGRFSLVLLAWREIASSVIAGLAILGFRQLGWQIHNIVGLAAQMATFVVLDALVAAILSRRLLTETLAIVRSRPRRADPIADGAATETPSSAITRTPTPRRMAFPLAVVADEGAGLLWVTTRDWPAVGRLDLRSGEWSWIETPPFPHVPNPDGHGGCWTALTRSNALVHVGADGSIDTFATPKTKELLVTALFRDSLWAVDATNKRLLRQPTEGGPMEQIELPDGFRRPDFVAVGPDERLWVADTHAPILAAITESGDVRAFTAPHNTRAIVPSPLAGGLWLGSSAEPAMSLIDTDGNLVKRLELPGVPFGLAPLQDGRLLAVLKDEELVAVVDPDVGGVVATLPAGSGSMPTSCAVYGDRCFLTLAGSSEILEFPLELPGFGRPHPMDGPAPVSALPPA